MPYVQRDISGTIKGVYATGTTDINTGWPTRGQNMTGLSDDDVERIAVSLAPKLVQCVRQGHHDFWIDPEEHYRARPGRITKSDLSR